VYRALRSVNPSPYLFYFDYGSYKIFGSSPEAQMVVADGMAEIHPIAGTFRRTGNYSEDQQLAQQLLQDPKENAEHIMLVDLARNDLSKNCIAVKVEKYREVQFFSHVIHLVSIVKGRTKTGISAYQIFADTFPAGTLSGAPKHKALQLIDAYEPTARGFYGGGIGMIGLDGSLNHAIIIRSFLCKDKKLYYQAGAGIVIDSIPESELQEVKNKLAALHRAMEMAEKLG
jgi:anthranilate synthase component 1